MVDNRLPSFRQGSRMRGKISISHKLAALVGLFLAPIALLVWLLVAQSSKDIAFADKELDGTTYLEAAWPLLGGLIAAQGGGAAQRQGSGALHQRHRGDARADRQDRRRLQPHPRPRPRFLLRHGHGRG